MCQTCLANQVLFLPFVDFRPYWDDSYQDVMQTTSEDAWTVHDELWQDYSRLYPECSTQIEAMTPTNPWDV